MTVNSGAKVHLERVILFVCSANESLFLRKRSSIFLSASTSFSRVTLEITPSILYRAIFRWYHNNFHSRIPRKTNDRRWLLLWLTNLLNTFYVYRWDRQQKSRWVCARCAIMYSRVHVYGVVCIFGTRNFKKKKNVLYRLSSEVFCWFPLRFPTFNKKTRT